MNFVKEYLKNEVRIYVSDVQEISQKIIDLNNSQPLPSLAISTAIAAFAPFSLINKHGYTIAKLKSDGPIKFVNVEVDKNGNLRASYGNDEIYTDYDNKDINQIPIRLAFGNEGELEIKNIDDGKEVSRGIVPMTQGDVVGDLAYYFFQSEQINTAIITDVNMDNNGKVNRSRSVIFQMLPDHSEEDIKWVEQFIKNNKLSSQTIEQYIVKINGKFLQEKKIEWYCTCNEEKLLSVVKLLSTKDKKDIIKKNGYIEVKCSYCKKSYKE